MPSGGSQGSGDQADQTSDGNSVTSIAILSEVTNQPLQLQRLAAAVQELDVAGDFREFVSWAPSDAAAAAAGDVVPDTGDTTAAAAAAESAAAASLVTREASGGAWGLHHSGLALAATADSNWGTGNWGTMVECKAGNSGDTLASNLFSTQCAVIPTMPECVYEHTIAAVPNFGERAAPQSSWMFFIVNFALLALLCAASFFEVYNGGISLSVE
jgi:hypothetical protein